MLELANSPPDESPRSTVTVPEIIDAYRRICVPKGAPDVRELTGDREHKLRCRIREHPTFDWWDELFKRIPRADFLFGNGSNGWRVSLDWLIANPSNAVKILEGKYDQAWRTHSTRN